MRWSVDSDSGGSSPTAPPDFQISAPSPKFDARCLGLFRPATCGPRLATAAGGATRWQGASGKKNLKAAASAVGFWGCQGVRLKGVHATDCRGGLRGAVARIDVTSRYACYGAGIGCLQPGGDNGRPNGRAAGCRFGQDDFTRRALRCAYRGSSIAVLGHWRVRRRARWQRMVLLFWIYW
jgi:hypothetical protein